MSDHSRPTSQAKPQPFAKRSLGQNFLVDRNVSARIVAALDISAADAVIEIGPGRGALTGHILDAGPRSLLLIEKDESLVEGLETLVAGRLSSAEVLRADALEFPWERVEERTADLPRGGALKIVGNLPYNVASPLMWEIFSRTRAYERAIFMVQKEVADRIVSQPDRGEYGALSVWLQSFTLPRRLFIVGPGCFRPRPKIDSAVLDFRPRVALPMGRCDFVPEYLSSLLKICFVKRRKQLMTILRPRFGDAIENWFKNRSLDVRLRPENLTPELFQDLSNFLGSRLVA